MSYDQTTADLLSENAALRERLALLEGERGEPFNGHSPLPWAAEDGPRDLWNKVVQRNGNSLVALCELPIHDADFIVHACNTYYSTQSALQSLRSAAQVDAEALRLAVQYIRALKTDPMNHHERLIPAWEALRANPLAAKMLEE
jgi:hypothetical protein